MTENDIIYRKACEILDDGKTNIISLTLTLIKDKDLQKEFDLDVKPLKTVTNEVRGALKEHKDIEINDHGIVRRKT
ncbi:MAG: hypothetical protein LUD47_04140 [Clostridia bacterium]|nr:hypothetical protein [Clostridia bacterium]